MGADSGLAAGKNGAPRINSGISRGINWAVLLLSIFLFSAKPGFAQSRYNGFDVSNALINPDLIQRGGPPKDGIPALTYPKFLPGNQADFLSRSDKVLGVYRNGVAKAYPIKILNWHELVNDKFAGESLIVSYCPLCGTGMAFLSTLNKTTYTFGVSGLLYNSDVLFYDRETHSLWSQILSVAISGKAKDTKLPMIALSHTSWQAWLAAHPNTVVLSTDTGYSRDYQHNPYQDYENTRKLYFPVQHQSDHYHPKESIVGLEVAGLYKAYPFVELSKSSNPLIDEIKGKKYKISFNYADRSATVSDVKGLEYPSVIAFWFAWYAFHPNTEIYRAKH